jgi:hypothetical protein
LMEGAAEASLIAPGYPLVTDYRFNGRTRFGGAIVEASPQYPLQLRIIENSVAHVSDPMPKIISPGWSHA